MAKYDVTKTNDGIDRLLAVTTNPRHRFMLQAYYRHRFLEIAGRYDEIFVPEMTVEKPVYHVHASGQHTKLEGQDAVKSLYRMWADTNQAIFYVESEQVEVADNYIASTSIYHQQVSGGSLMQGDVLLAWLSLRTNREKSAGSESGQTRRERNVSLYEFAVDDLAIRRPGAAHWRGRVGARPGQGRNHQARPSRRPDDPAGRQAARTADQAAAVR